MDVNSDATQQGEAVSAQTIVQRVEAIAAQEDVCFVVMPFGKTAVEQRWYRGWFEAVIKPGIVAAGYRAVLAAAEEQPGAINDEIRAHLAFDPMVVIDLGGVHPDDEPNPNVMYELGIRHALGLPLVLMAWPGQRLPFDVSNQRAITEDRDMLNIETVKKKLKTLFWRLRTASIIDRWMRLADSRPLKPRLLRYPPIQFCPR